MNILLLLIFKTDCNWLYNLKGESNNIKENQNEFLISYSLIILTKVVILGVAPLIIWRREL